MPEPTRHWHVTLTLAGERCEALLVRAALQRLSSQRPFMDSVRFTEDSAEIQFWDQGESMIDIASITLRLWAEHRESAGLPPWQVVGMEIIERPVFDRRRSGGAAFIHGQTLSPIPI